MKLVVVGGEDSSWVETEEGKRVCSVSRDDDSYETMTKVLRALGFELIEKSWEEVDDRLHGNSSEALSV